MHRPIARPIAAGGRRLAVLVTAASFAVALGACGSDPATTDAGGTGGSTTTAAPATSAVTTTAPTTAPTTTEPVPVVPGQVVIRDYEFLPPTITVAAGGTITWQNTDDVDHFVLSEDETSVDTGHITPGQAATATLATPGTYEYYCDIHNAMKATIIVE